MVTIAFERLGDSAKWQSHLLTFLSNRKKYRLFGWEFGPTLLEHLHQFKKEEGPNYLRKGMVVTWIGTPLASLLAYASKDKSASPTVVALSTMVFGVLITLAMDYQKTREKEPPKEISSADCFKLLEKLGELPQYWWWPWSKKIVELQITQKEAERVLNYVKYSFRWRWTYALVTNVALHQLCIARSEFLYWGQKLHGEKMESVSSLGAIGNPFFNSIPFFKKSQSKGELVPIKLDHLMRRAFHSEGNSCMTLKEALYALNKADWLPLYLDESLGRVRAGTQKIEEHNQYFSKKAKEILKLSLIYHPDKQQEGIDTNATQRLISTATQALKKIHHYVMSRPEMFEYRVVYRLFEQAPIQSILKGDVFEMAHLIAKSDLSSLSFWEEELLMRGRNAYINDTRNLLEQLKREGNKDGDIREIIDSMRRSVYHNYQIYKQLYQKKWINNLRELSKKCTGELEFIKNDIDILIKQSEERYQIFQRHGFLEKEADIRFVRPIIEYDILLNLYLNFFEIVDKTDLFSSEEIAIEEREKIGALSCKELLQSAEETHSRLISEIERERKKEFAQILLFKLERSVKLLEGSFEIKETLVEREIKRNKVKWAEWEAQMEELQKKIQESEKKMQESEKKMQEWKRMTKAMKTYYGKSKKLDHELRGAINEESEDKIIREATRCELPQEAMESIIEAVKAHREEIIKEKRVSDAMIEEGVSSFLAQNASASGLRSNLG